MNDIMPIVSRYVRKVSQSGITVYQAILFGSWARGSARQDSDIDVCIVSPALGKDWVAETVNLRRLAFDIDARIELIPLAHEDIHDRFNPLVQEINKYGVKVKI